METNKYIDYKSDGGSCPALWQPIANWFNQYPNLNIKLWNKDTQTYRDENIGYLINHTNGVVYIIDKTIMKFPECAFQGHYTIYKNKFCFQQHISNRIRLNKWHNDHHVGRACSPYLYIKKIGQKNNPIQRIAKKSFALLVGTISNNLSHYYDKPRGHKGFWISPNMESDIFYNHLLPKHGRYTKLKILKH
ncbi:MAG: hypothetical protein LBT17_01505 [Mycoplasmataceae bacterium]|nr:hypothetical protein [Mycoplasmataceae bacterium]